MTGITDLENTRKIILYHHKPKTAPSYCRRRWLNRVAPPAPHSIPDPHIKHHSSCQPPPAKARVNRHTPYAPLANIFHLLAFRLVDMNRLTTRVILARQGGGQPMCRSCVVACVSLLLMTTLSGCFGLAVTYPAVCENETPSPEIHGLFSMPPFFSGDKGDFLEKWGKPDGVISTSEGREIWTYERNLWCGVTPAFVVIVPLLLPLCDGYDEIEFDGDRAVNLNTRHSVTAGIIIPSVAVKDDDCRYPHPFKDSYDISKAIPSDAGLIILYLPSTRFRKAYFTIYLDKQYVVTLRSSTYYALLANPGHKELSITDKDNRRLTVDIQPGEKCYISLRPTPFRRPRIEVVAEETALAELSSLSPISTP